MYRISNNHSNTVLLFLKLQQDKTVLSKIYSEISNYNFQ